MALYADQRDAGHPGVLYVATGRGGYDLYREQRPASTAFPGVDTNSR